MPSDSVKFKSLLIFNLSLDLDEPILSFTHEWVYEFSLRYEKVLVFSTHVGRRELPQNVEVIRIGGGNIGRRIVAIMRLWRSILFVIKNPNCHIFHHMSTKTLVFPGLVFQFLGRRQGVWYSHSYPDPWLRFTSKMNLTYFSPSESSFPINNSKIDLRVTGHGIDFAEFQDLGSLDLQNKNSKRALFVGRIVPVKKIETIIETISLSNGEIKELVLVGPANDTKYLEKLKRLALIMNVSLLFIGMLDRRKLQLLLSNFEYIFSETPKSTDKAAIESAGYGLYLISSNLNSLELCGMFELFDFLGRCPQSLAPSAQLDFLNSLSRKERQSGRRVVAESTRRQNNLKTTIDKICHGLIA